MCTNVIKSRDIANKMDKIKFSNDYVASDLLDSHVLGNEKQLVPAMERSTRSSLDANSVEVSTLDIRFHFLQAISEYNGSNLSIATRMFPIIYCCLFIY